jgi:riboflavin synthase
MFTGLIAEKGTLIRLQTSGTVWRLSIEAPGLTQENIRLGESVAVNGICLTVVKIQGRVFEVEAVSETQRKTTLAQWRTGDRMNLERALCLGDRLDGHWVAGHVDGVVHVHAVFPEGAARRIQFKVPHELFRYIAPKGSVALDGVSLTVAELRPPDVFSIALIPHTLAETTGEMWPVGCAVNLEVDLIARYVERLGGFSPASALTMGKLRSAGF